MALNFRRFVNGINLVPKIPNVNAEMGDLEVDSSTGRLKYHNGTISDNVVTATSTDTLENKTIADPDITILDNPIVFQETGGGSDTISMTAPASVPTSYTFKLPPDPGTIDYVLRTDGTGATSWVAPTIDVTPTGATIVWPGNTLPTGWLWADGEQYDPALYPNLFAVCGFQFNTGGENPGWFRVPRINGRVVAGKDDMGGTPANLLTTAGSGVDGVTLGATGGTQNHSLTADENGPHTHIQDAHDHGTGSYGNASSSVSGTITASASAVSGTVGGSDGTHPHAVNDPGHSHLVYLQEDDGGGAGRGVQFGANNTKGTIVQNGQAPYPGVDTTGLTVTSTNSGHGHAHSLTAAAQSIIHALTAVAQMFSGISGSTVAINQSSGLGDAHQNTQPTIILNYIIKV